jgi:hypothetical protein
VREDEETVPEEPSPEVVAQGRDQREIEL